MRMTFQSTFITGRICTTSSDIGFDMCDKRVCLKFNKTFSGFVSFAVRGSLARRMQWMLEECRRLSTDKCTTEFCGFVSITYRLFPASIQWSAGHERSFFHQFEVHQIKRYRCLRRNRRIHFIERIETIHQSLLGYNKKLACRTARRFKLFRNVVMHKKP